MVEQVNRSSREVLDTLADLLRGFPADRDKATSRERLDLAIRGLRVASQAQAVAALLVAEADTARASLKLTGTPLATYLATHTKISTRQGAGMVHQANRLASHPVACQAVVDGQISAAHGQAVGRAMEQLPMSFTDDQISQAEVLLVDLAGRTTPDKVEDAAVTIAAQVDPVDADRREQTRLAQERDIAWAGRSLSWRSHRGSIVFSGSLPVLEGTAFTTIIDAYAMQARRADLDNRGSTVPGAGHPDRPRGSTVSDSGTHTPATFPANHPTPDTLNPDSPTPVTAHPDTPLVDSRGPHIDEGDTGRWGTPTLETLKLDSLTPGTANPDTPLVDARGPHTGEDDTGQWGTPTLGNLKPDSPTPGTAHPDTPLVDARGPHTGESTTGRWGTPTLETLNPDSPTPGTAHRHTPASAALRPDTTTLDALNLSNPTWDALNVGSPTPAVLRLDRPTPDIPLVDARKPHTPDGDTRHRGTPATDTPVVTLQQRRADALVALVDAVAHHHTAPTLAGDRPTVTILLDYNKLVTHAADAGILSDGTTLSAGDLRRVCCDANLIPMVLGTASEPLDVGRTNRFVPAPLRKAVTIRDRHCQFPSCDTPAHRCDVHHIRPWQEGGTTSLNNLVLVCPHHHGIIEPDPYRTRNQWRVEIGPNGHPVFHPPRGYPDPGPSTHTTNPPPRAGPAPPG